MGAKTGLLLLGSFLSILGIMLVITSRSPDRNILTRVLVEIMDLFPWPRISARTRALMLYDVLCAVFDGLAGLPGGMRGSVRSGFRSFFGRRSCCLGCFLGS
jgi:hypothetical protein